MSSRSPFRFYLAMVVILGSVFVLSSTPGNSIAGYRLDSAHGGYNTPGRGVSRLAGWTEGNCAHCHEQHASIDGSEPPPVKPGPSGYMLFADLANNDFCNYCHDGGTANADNIETQILKNPAHKPGSTIYSNSTPFLGENLTCNLCHDSHEARLGNHNEAADGNKVFTTGPLTVLSGPIYGISGESVSSWTSGGAPPAGTENLGSVSTTAIDPVTLEYQLCFKCHAGQLDFSARMDVSLQFNINNAARHPVTLTEGVDTWNNTFLKITPGAFAVGSPWTNAANVNKPMYCSDCHGSNNPTVDPKGPHGSTNQYLLKASGPGVSLDNLCLRCHANPAIPGNSAWQDLPAYGNPSGGTPPGDHSLPQHTQAGGNTLGCLACHGNIGNPVLSSNIHGANYTGNANGVLTTGMPSKAFILGPQITKHYYFTVGGPLLPGNRSCATTLGCHQNDLGNGYAY